MAPTLATEVKVRCSTCYFPFSNDTLSNVDLMIQAWIQVEEVFNYIAPKNASGYRWRCAIPHKRNTYANERNAKRHFKETGHRIFDHYKPQSSNQADGSNQADSSNQVDGSNQKDVMTFLA